MSRAVNDGWTDAQLATVKRMADEGHSAGKIGTAIGKTRNAVIGKILRMGGKLGKLQPKPTERKARSATKWVEGGRGRPPASVKPREKAAVGSRQSAIEGEWDRAPVAGSPVVNRPAPSPSPSHPAGSPPLPPPGGEERRAAVAPARLPTAEARLPLPQLPVPSLPPISTDHALALIPMSFLEAIDRDRCLYFADDAMAPAGPDMPVCGAGRAHAPPQTRYCRRHLRSQVAAS